MMSIGALAICALVGAALGAIYLGLLWVAVRSLPENRGGVLVFLGLALARVALLLGSMAAAVALGLPIQGIAAAVVGFIVTRFAATRWFGNGPPGETTWK